MSSKYEAFCGTWCWRTWQTRSYSCCCLFGDVRCPGVYWSIGRQAVSWCVAGWCVSEFPRKDLVRATNPKSIKVQFQNSIATRWALPSLLPAPACVHHLHQSRLRSHPILRRLQPPLLQQRRRELPLLLDQDQVWQTHLDRNRLQLPPNQDPHLEQVWKIQLAQALRLLLVVDDILFYYYFLSIFFLPS